MAKEEESPKQSRISAFVSVGKDLVALLRDGALFVLAILLVLFPGAFNTILVNAGFVKGSLAGFTWESKLADSNVALKEAAATIEDLQKRNDEMTRLLAEAQKKLADPAFQERVVEVSRENVTAQKSAQQVQTSVSSTIASNEPLLEKARSGSQTAAAASRPLSDYLVGLQTVGVSDEVRKELNAKLGASGYGLDATTWSYPAGERPSWFAPRSTVFYYGSPAYDAAKELAERMKELTGQDFAVQRGAGLGVDPGKRDVTLFVHYLKR